MLLGQPAQTDSRRPMGPSDLLKLAALGITSRSATSAAEIHCAILDITDPFWAPVGDVVADSLSDMVEDGLLRRDGRSGLMATDAGKELLADLFLRPTGRPGCLLERAALRLKLAFIDLAPSEIRRRYLESAIRDYEGEIAACERRCDDCRPAGHFGRQWRQHETERLRGDLSMLRHLVAGPHLSSSSLH